jgi:hypothetical protein
LAQKKSGPNGRRRRGDEEVVCPQPVPILGHAASHPSSFQLAQTSFEPNLDLYKYPSTLIPGLLLLLHMTSEDGTDSVFGNDGT